MHWTNRAMMRKTFVEKQSLMQVSSEKLMQRLGAGNIFHVLQVT